MHATPADAIAAMIAARAKNDVDAAMACYAPGATIVASPGKTLTGEEAIRSHIALARSLRLWFRRHDYVVSGETALHLSQFAVHEGDKVVYEGRTADVLRRQADGGWLIAIDNPWLGQDAG